MAQLRVGAGVTVDAPQSVRVVPKAAARATLAAAPGAPADHSALGQGLQGAGFALAADFELQPGAAAPLAAGAAQPVKVSVDVRGDESAVLLLEAPGRVFAWSYPQARQKKPPGLGLTAPGGGAPATLIFQIAPARSQGQALGFGLSGLKGSPVWDWVVDKTVGVIRARVLKFVVGKIEDVVVDHIEGGLQEGLTSLASGDPTQWRADGAPIAALQGPGPRKILLMVHGTFSTTTGSFGALTGTVEGKAFLDAARTQYDAVLGFDHKTLARGADQNASDMLQALTNLGLPRGSTLDAVAYSRGGLVYRSFAETLLAAQRPDLKLGRAAFVACTNGGTHLAEPKNWEILVDLYTNIAMASARLLALVAGGGALNPVVSETLQLLGKFVQYFSVVAIADRRVPGLADMEPDSPLGHGLNTAPDGLARLADYFAITSNFRARFDPAKGITKELEQMLLDTVTNQLFQDDNDLVVDTDSMTTFGTRQPRLQDVHVFKFGDVEDVYHTVYFGTAQAPTQLSAWLLGA